MTPRETEVLEKLLTTEDGVQEIADSLYISRRMLQRYIASIYEKDGNKNPDRVVSKLCGFWERREIEYFFKGAFSLICTLFAGYPVRRGHITQEKALFVINLNIKAEVLFMLRLSFWPLDVAGLSRRRIRLKVFRI